MFWNCVTRIQRKLLQGDKFYIYCNQARDPSQCPGFTKMYLVCLISDNSLLVLLDTIWKCGNICLPDVKGNSWYLRAKDDWGRTAKLDWRSPQKRKSFVSLTPNVNSCRWSVWLWMWMAYCVGFPTVANVGTSQSDFKTKFLPTLTVKGAVLIFKWGIDTCVSVTNPSSSSSSFPSFWITLDGQ